MKKIFSIFAALLFVGSIFAGEETVTYVFTSKSWEATMDDAAADWISNKDGAGFSNDGVQVTTRFSGAGATSPVSFSEISKIVVTYNTNRSAGKGTFDVKIGDNDAETEDWQYSSESGDGRSANFTTTFDYATPQSGAVTLTVNTTTNSAYVVSIAITYITGAPTKVGNPQFSVEAGNFQNPFDLELSCSTEDANIYYTLDGNEPTSASTLYEGAFEISATTTVKAIAIKDGLENSDVVSATYTKVEPVTSNNIDFETADLDLYVNWDFSNIAIASTAITAHGGTYYGKTDGKASASITSKAAIALPGDLTFFTSKESNNTTASSWEVEVSADKEEWTLVAQFDATEGSKGEWTERNVDLSAYTNVYVRISYSGSTAVRAIDDITLADAVPAAVATPAFSVPAGSYAEAQSVELSCETEDAKIYYTLDGTDPTAESTEYTAAIELKERGSYTIKAIAIKGEDESKVASATYNINLPYTLAELVAAELDDPSTVNVVLKDEVIKDFYIYNENRSGIVFNIQKNDKDIRIFFNNQTTIVDWEKEGKLSGTLLNAKWSTYKSEWQITPATGFKWADLEYTAPVPSAVENAEVETKAIKFFENGQLVILKNGVRYNAQGAIVK